MADEQKQSYVLYLFPEPWAELRVKVPAKEPQPDQFISELPDELQLCEMLGLTPHFPR